MRAKARAIERAYSKLENELRRSPDDKEVAAELGVTEDELATTLGQISFVGVVALDELLSAGSERGSGATVGDTIAGGGHDPVEAFESEEMRQVLADAINRMPDRERLVLTLYYYEGLTLAEIGNVLGVTESRVCQIHTKAIFQLRSRLSRTAPRTRHRHLAPFWHRIVALVRRLHVPNASPAHPVRYRATRAFRPSRVGSRSEGRSSVRRLVLVARRRRSSRCRPTPAAAADVVDPARSPGRSSGRSIRR